MKRKIIGICLSLFFLTGCFNDKGNAADNFIKKYDNLKSYNIQGELEIINNEDSYKYDVDIAFKENDNFKVSLVNKMNSHEQIIIRNNEGVYLLTPSLNKSFKFQSEWPYNNSQIYLLQSIIKDTKNDEEKNIEVADDEYIITSSVNYLNNQNLVKQHIYLDNKYNIKKIEIVNKDDIVKMKMAFNKIDLDAKYNNDYFSLNTNMKNTDVQNTITEIEDIIYPMYMPANTYLKSQDNVILDNGERIILSFTGESPFTLIEQTVNVTDDYEIVSVSGDPEMLLDTIGSVGDNSVSFISNGIEYYAVSEVLDKGKLLEVIQSISVLPVGK